MSEQQAPSTALAPVGLLCEFLAAPEHVYIGARTPHFCWVMRDAECDARQSGYQILVTTELEHLAADRADLWDSGQVDTSDSSAAFFVRYAGKPLRSFEFCHWKVRSWNHRGECSPYSAPQTFLLGKLEAPHSTARAALECLEIEPQQIVRKAFGHYFVSFPRAAFGTLEFELPEGFVAEGVKIVLGERCRGDRVWRHSEEDDLEGGEHIVAFETTMEFRGDRFTPLDLPAIDSPGAAPLPRGLKGILPFRYVEVRNFPLELQAKHLRQLAVIYPFNEDAAHFESSDDALNDVWELCKYTIKATSAFGIYVDGNRERLPYEADAYINQLGHYCCDREYAIARFTHEYLLKHPTWPTEWQLHSVLMAWEDYRYTGDATSLAAHYTDLRAKTLKALAREDGLISTETGLVSDEVLASIHMKRPLRDITDWPPSERFDFDMRPVNTVVNAFHYRALVLLGRIADVLQRGEDAEEFRQRAQRVRESAMVRLYDPDRGLFLDGEDSPNCSLHANLFPLALGMVDAERRDRIVEFVISRGMGCSVYAAQYLVEGLYRAGADDAALALLSSTAERSWAHMSRDVGSTIALEAWDQRFKPNLDWSHAWGAAPANLIPRWLMGVRPLEAGFRKFLIEPRPGGLTTASLTMPTIRGSVSIRFNNDPGESFRLELDLPANTEARVGLPAPRGTDPAVFLDGTAIDFEADLRTVWVDGVGSGRHILSCQRRGAANLF